MQFTLGERIVRMSVKEFAAFRSPASQPEYTQGLWRTKLGQEIHQEVQARPATNEQEIKNEISIKLSYKVQDWSIEIQGRVDQIFEQGNKLLISEIKSTSVPLPKDEKELKQIYPEYFIQTACYLYYFNKHPDYSEHECSAQLHFIDINERTEQFIPLGENVDSILKEQALRILPYLQDRWNSLRTIKKMQNLPPFKSYRDGQENLKLKLEEKIHASPHLFIQAPTGFGKTGILLEQALNLLKEGSFERIIYLTSKSTGQIAVIDQLKQMLPKENSPRYFQMRNKEEHGRRESDEENPDVWETLGLLPEEIYKNNTVTLERILEFGEQYNLDPYSISKACLPFADIWIGDFNYIFSPHSRSVFTKAFTFSETQTILIVDEAHNLPQRAESALSHSLHRDDIQAVIDELMFNPLFSPSRLISRLEVLLQSMAPIEGYCDRYETSFIEEFHKNTLSFVLTLHSTEMDNRFLSDESRHTIRQLESLLGFFKLEPEQQLLWSNYKSELFFTCIDASEHSYECFKKFGHSLFSSATLLPINSYATACGLEPQKVPLLFGQTPWRENAYSVAIDTRVDTRYQNRESHFPLTADTIIRMASTTPGQPTVVFFPSYKYAEAILNRIDQQNPYLKVILQQRNLNLLEQTEFIESSINYADILLLVLGSSFAEGIDCLGGKVENVIVVSPALPEVNPVQKAKQESWKEKKNPDPFYETYQVPGITKVNQALGRFVRAPGQKAKVLLHCNRFKEESYQNLLDPEYYTETYITSDEELQLWFNT